MINKSYDNLSNRIIRFILILGETIQAEGRVTTVGHCCISTDAGLVCHLANLRQVRSGGSTLAYREEQGDYLVSDGLDRGLFLQIKSLSHLFEIIIIVSHGRMYARAVQCNVLTC